MSEAVDVMAVGFWRTELKSLGSGGIVRLGIISMTEFSLRVLTAQLSCDVLRAMTTGNEAQV